MCWLTAVSCVQSGIVPAYAFTLSVGYSLGCNGGLTVGYAHRFGAMSLLGDLPDGTWFAGYYRRVYILHSQGTWDSHRDIGGSAAWHNLDFRPVSPDWRFDLGVAIADHSEQLSLSIGVFGGYGLFGHTSQVGVVFRPYRANIPVLELAVDLTTHGVLQIVMLRYER